MLQLHLSDRQFYCPLRCLILETWRYINKRDPEGCVMICSYEYLSCWKDFMSYRRSETHHKHRFACKYYHWETSGMNKQDCYWYVLFASWWRHQMETLSTYLALWAGNSMVTGEFPTQRPVTRSFIVFFELGLNKWLSTQSLGWWFETPSWSLWRHCHALFTAATEWH